MIKNPARCISSPYCLVLALMLLWAPLHEGGGTHLGWTVSRVLALAAVMTALWRSMGRGKLLISKTPFNIFVVVLGLLLAVGYVVADYKYSALQWAMSYATMAAVFFIAGHVERRGEADGIEKALVIAGVLQAVIGIYQYFHGTARASGTFFNPSYYGGFLAALTAIPLSRLIGPRDDSYYSLPEKSIYLIVLFLLIAGSMVSGSRSSLVIILTVFVVVGYIRVGAWVAAIGAALVVLLVIVPNPVKNRLEKLGETDVYAWSRVGIWRSSISIIVEHPLGVGPGMYKLYARRHAFPVEGAYAKYGKVAHKAHGAYLDLAVELSPLSTLILIGMVVVILFRGVRNARLERNMGPAAWIGIFAAVAIHATFDSIHKSPPIAFLGAVSAGISYYRTRPKTKLTAIKMSPGLRWFLIPVAALAGWIILSPMAAYYAKEKAKSMDIDEADEWMELATRLAPGNSDYWFLRGVLYRELWKRDNLREYLESALKYYEIAIEANPMEVGYLSAMGNLLGLVAAKNMNPQIYATAIEYYKRAEVYAPFNPFYSEREGEMFLEIGKPEAAIDAFERAIKVEPNYLEARLMLARTFNQMGRIEEARKQYRILTEKAQNIPNRELSEYEEELSSINMEKVMDEMRELSPETGTDKFSSP